MGKVFISEFKKKLAKKSKKESLNRQAVSINIKSLLDERTRRFNNGLSKYLTNNHYRNNIKQEQLKLHSDFDKYKDRIIELTKLLSTKHELNLT